MGWRSVIITQHAKLTYSMNMMIVQTRMGLIRYRLVILIYYWYQPLKQLLQVH